MKNITDILKEFGIEIPADKLSDFNAKVAENYKTTAEHDKRINQLTADRDQYKERAETAENTLKGFDGIDAEAMKKEIADWKVKAETAEKNYSAKLAERDFEDALRNAPELADEKFTSKAAKAAILSKVREMGLKQDSGTIYGLSQALDKFRAEDASAFVDEQQQKLEDNKARFTTSMSSTGGKKYANKDEIMSIKDATERQAAIRENITLFK